MSAVGAVLAGLLVASVIGAAAAVRIRRTFVVVSVGGVSMEPAFYAGDRVVIRRVRPARIPRGAAVVIARPVIRGEGTDVVQDPGAPDWIIKRVAALPGDPVPAVVRAARGLPASERVPTGHLVVLGDNPTASYDSRRAGFFPADQVLGVVLRRLTTT